LPRSVCTYSIGSVSGRGLIHLSIIDDSLSPGRLGCEHERSVQALAQTVAACTKKRSIGQRLAYYREKGAPRGSRALSAILRRRPAARRQAGLPRAWIAAAWAQPWYELWLEEDINAGNTEAPNYYAKRYAYTRAKWIGVGRGWIDPVKEAQAAQLRMEIGISTLEDECAKQGKDWEEVLEQRAREKVKIEALGLDVADLQTILGVEAPTDKAAA